jgi:peptidase E
MAKLYLLGGENLRRQDAKEINLSAFQDAGGAPKVLVFAWAHAAFGRNYSYRKRVFDYFRSLGAGDVDFAEFSEAPEETARKVAGSNLVYMTGGFASALIERLKARNVNGMLREYKGVIVGRSAGALALCKRCVVTDRNKRTAKIVEGLGHVDLCLKVHYKPSKDKMLRLLSKQERIYAIPNRAALAYDGDTLSFIGDLLLFENGERFLLKDSNKVKLGTDSNQEAPPALDSNQQ